MAEMKSSHSFVECSECGALIANWSTHREWHENLKNILANIGPWGF